MRHGVKRAFALMPVVVMLAIGGGCSNNNATNNMPAQRNVFIATFRETGGPPIGKMNYTLRSGEMGITHGLYPTLIDIYEHSEIPDSSADSIEFWFTLASPLEKKTYVMGKSADVTINDAQRGLYGALKCTGTIDLTYVTMARVRGDFSFYTTALGFPNDTVYMNGSFDLAYNK